MVKDTINNNTNKITIFLPVKCQNKLGIVTMSSKAQQNDNLCYPRLKLEKYH